jgi:hypothetical protein
LKKEEIYLNLKEIGFTRFENGRKEKRDGKERWIWTYPINGHNDWLTIILVVENEQFLIDRYNNPLGKTFDSKDVAELIEYIRAEIWTY